MGSTTTAGLRTPIRVLSLMRALIEYFKSRSRRIDTIDARASVFEHFRTICRHHRALMSTHSFLAAWVSRCGIQDRCCDAELHGPGTMAAELHYQQRATEQQDTRPLLDKTKAISKVQNTPRWSAESTRGLLERNST